MKRPETVQTKKHEKPKMKKKAVLSRLLPYLMRYKFLMLGAILLTVGGNLLSLAGPYISGLAVDAMELGRGKVNFEKVGCYGVLMVVMYAISAALSYALTRLMIVISRFLSTPSGWRATAKTDKVFICFCAKGRRICLFKTRKEKNLPMAF